MIQASCTYEINYSNDNICDIINFWYIATKHHMKKHAMNAANLLVWMFFFINTAMFCIQVKPVGTKNSLYSNFPALNGACHLLFFSLITSFSLECEFELIYEEVKLLIVLMATFHNDKQAL